MMNLKIDIERIKAQVILEAEQNLKQHLEEQTKNVLHSDYSLGVTIRQHLQTFVDKNLDKIIKDEINKIDLSEKIEKAVEHSVLNLVHTQLKTLNYKSK